MKSNVVYVFAVVLGMTFLLLLVTFRSLVIPLKAIALNLLPVGAAYGILKLVFPDGHLVGLVGRVDGRGHDMAAAVPLRGPLRALD